MQPIMRSFAPATTTYEAIKASTAEFRRTKLMTLEDIERQVVQTDRRQNRLMQCNPLVFNSLVKAANQRYGLNLLPIAFEKYQMFRKLDYVVQ